MSKKGTKGKDNKTYYYDSDTGATKVTDSSGNVIGTGTTNNGGSYTPTTPAPVAGPPIPAGSTTKPNTGWTTSPDTQASSVVSAIKSNAASPITANPNVKSIAQVLAAKEAAAPAPAANLNALTKKAQTQPSIQAQPAATPTSTVIITPSGETINGYITNGVTTKEDGSRIDVGSKVKTDNGWYEMTADGGKQIADPTAVKPDSAAAGNTVADIILSDGTRVKGFIKDGATYLSDGNRIPVGAKVNTANGWYEMTATGGKQVADPTAKPETNNVEVLQNLILDYLNAQKQELPAYPEVDVDAYENLIEEYQNAGLSLEEAMLKANTTLAPQQQLNIMNTMDVYNSQEELLPYALAGRNLLNTGMMKGGEAALSQDKAKALDKTLLSNQALAAQLAQTLMSASKTDAGQMYNNKLAALQAVAQNNLGNYNAARENRANYLNELTNLSNIMNTSNVTNFDQFITLLSNLNNGNIATNSGNEELAAIYSYLNGTK